jgi:hypothetical protein
MAKCDKQVFGDVTSANFADLIRQGESLGMPITGKTGQATRDGVTIAWTYDVASSTLTIECTDAPSFVPCSMINSKIDSAVSGALAKLRSASQVEQA